MKRGYGRMRKSSSTRVNTRQQFNGRGKKGGSRRNVRAI